MQIRKQPIRKLCDVMQIFRQKTNAGKDTKRSDDEVVAINGRVLEYKCTTEFFQRNFF